MGSRQLLCCWVIALSTIHLVWGQAETTNEAVHVLHYDLELQIEPRFQRVAGTQRMQVRLQTAQTSYWFLLADSLTLKYVRRDGQSQPVQRRGDTVVVSWGKEEAAGTEMLLELLYGGSPPEAQDIWTEDGVALDPIRLPAHHWWPCFPGQAADSIDLHVIFSREGYVWSTGERGVRLGRPGNYVRRSFRFRNQVWPEQVQVFAGHWEETTLNRSINGQARILRFLAPVGNKEAAQAHLEHLSSALELLERRWGEYPYWQLPFYWSGEMNMADESFGGMSPDMIRLLAGHWFGRSVSSGDELAERLFQALAEYAELMWVEAQFDRQTATRYLLDQEQVPAGAGLLYTLRRLLQDDQRWWRMMRGMYGEFAGQQMTGPMGIDYLSQVMGQDVYPICHQYLLYQKPPRLQYRIIGSKKNSSLYLRWESEVDSFRLPVQVQVGKRVETLRPGDRWDKWMFKGISPDEIRMIPDQSYFLLEQVKS